MPLVTQVVYPWLSKKNMVLREAAFIVLVFLAFEPPKASPVIHKKELERHSGVIMLGALPGWFSYRCPYPHFFPIYECLGSIEARWRIRVISSVPQQNLGTISNLQGSNTSKSESRSFSLPTTSSPQASTRLLRVRKENP